MRTLRFGAFPEVFATSIAEINREHLIYNVSSFRKLTGSRIIAVVKSDAYGHGLESIVRILEPHVDMFALASMEEALKLETSKDVLVLQPPSTFEEIYLASSRRNLVLNLCTWEALEISRKHELSIRVHVEVDTGMNRTGIWYEEFPEFVENLIHTPHVKLEGIYTHYANADNEEDDFTRIQYERFLEVLRPLNTEGIILHSANTSSAIRYEFTRMDAIRIGIGLYGVLPSDFLYRYIDLKPVMSLKSRVIQKKFLKRGESVGYGRTFKAHEDMEIAIVSIGYADGYPMVSNARVYAGGRYRKVLGKVSMDMIVIEGKGLGIGDEVELWGENVPLLEVAKASGRIPYELMTSVGSRVRRVYT